MYNLFSETIVQDLDMFITDIDRALYKMVKTYNNNYRELIRSLQHIYNVYKTVLNLSSMYINYLLKKRVMMEPIYLYSFDYGLVPVIAQ